MSNVRDTLQEAFESVRGTVRETVHSMRGTVDETVGAVKHTADDVRKLVDRYPWLFVGGFVALGYLGYRLLASKGPSGQGQPYGSAGKSFSESAEAMASGSGGTVPTSSSSGVRQHNGRHETWECAPAAESIKTETKSENWSNVMEEMKALAIGVPLSILRDKLATQGAEIFRQQVTHLINTLTERLGGKVIQERGNS